MKCDWAVASLRDATATMPSFPVGSVGLLRSLGLLPRYVLHAGLQGVPQVFCWCADGRLGLARQLDFLSWVEEL